MAGFTEASCAKTCVVFMAKISMGRPVPGQSALLFLTVGRAKRVCEGRITALKISGACRG